MIYGFTRLTDYVKISGILRGIKSLVANKSHVACRKLRGTLQYVACMSKLKVAEIASPLFTRFEV